MRRNRVVKVLSIVACVAGAMTAVGFVLMSLWNWLMPAIFGLRTLTFAQSLGLLLLARLLFGGFHRHGGGRPGWKNRMRERWSGLSPEERERFQQGMRNRRGCGWRQPEVEATERGMP